MMLGGDEVGLSCFLPGGEPMLSKAFDLDPHASAWLKAHGMNSSQATDYFWGRARSALQPPPSLPSPPPDLSAC